MHGAICSAFVTFDMLFLLSYRRFAPAWPCLRDFGRLVHPFNYSIGEFLSVAPRESPRSAMHVRTSATVTVDGTSSLLSCRGSTMQAVPNSTAVCQHWIDDHPETGDGAEPKSCGCSMRGPLHSPDPSFEQLGSRNVSCHVPDMITCSRAAVAPYLRAPRVIC